MLQFVSKPFSQSEWNAHASAFKDLSLMQTWEYAEASASTANWRIERGIFLTDGAIVGAVQALVRTVPLSRKGLVWINQGPLWNRGVKPDISLVFEMMNVLREHWVGERGMYLRIAPPVDAGNADVRSFESAGYKLADNPGWSSARIDLSKPVEQIRAELKRKWRGDLNSAERHGVACEMGTSKALFESFLAHYKSFVAAKGFATVVTAALLRRLQELLPKDRKMWIIDGRLGTESLGGMLIACYGETALALAGSHPNTKGRAVHSGHQVWWQTVLKMKELGYRWLDLGGMDPELTLPSILHFKSGMGATKYQLIGEFESSREGLFERAVRWQIRRARPNRKTTG